ncbi:hypothetical protein BJV77DRAFT_239790 [Russula vinacea]|nr:hypothetical protein BJV77DRAFT_239790 [Russula vinacea]
MFLHPDMMVLNRHLSSGVGAQSAVDDLSPERAEQLERVRTTVRSTCRAAGEFRVSAFVLSGSPARFAPLSRCGYTNYARLIMFSFGFQKSFKRGYQPDDEDLH